jgi:acyl-coenzyme A synthetase/AMP-(fatty) acid ligase
MLFTSGTTGAYKKVMMAAESEEKRNAARASSWSLDGNTVLHGLDFPIWTGAGFKQPSAIWHTGGCVIFDQRPDKLERFLAYAITKTTMVESMLRKLLEAQETSKHERREFEMVFGAGVLSQTLAEKTTRQLTQHIQMQYGCTELATYALHAHYKTKDDLFWMMPVTDRIVQVVDQDGMECPVGSEGELRVQLSDIDCAGYLDDAQANASMFRDGFFHPGDMAVARADGRIRILGRCSDVLNVQGNKLAVAPMELVVKESLGVEEVCLFSGLNEQGETELVIVIQAAAAPAISELQAMHANFKLFESLRIEAVREFPRAQSGMRKIQREALRAQVFAGR